MTLIYASDYLPCWKNFRRLDESAPEWEMNDCAVKNSTSKFTIKLWFKKTYRFLAKMFILAKNN